MSSFIELAANKLEGIGPFLYALGGVFSIYLVYVVLKIGSRDKRLPPGPPTIPILGNLHQIPPHDLYQKFKTWGQEYGPIFSLKLGPTTMIVLYDRKAVHELVDKRGVIYSDRPKNTVAQIVTRGHSFAFMDATPKWRAERKIVAHNFSPRALDENAAPIQEAEMTMLMSDLLDAPAGFYHHIMRTTCSISNILAWGHRGRTYEDFWGHCVYLALDEYSSSLELGSNPPIDEFPILQWIPKRFAKWRQRADQSYNAMHSIWTEARRRVDQRREKGIKRHALVDRILDDEKGNHIELTVDEQNHFLGLVVEGGAETTANSMLTAILCLAMHPEVQKKAHKELDEVCGATRMPIWSDFDRLPYINAIVKEGMRWHTVLPTGCPHRLTQDDWYNGMLLPKDSIIVIPTDALHRSGELGYEEPEVFRPERFLKHPKLANDYAGSPNFENRDHYGYGAGRRICPGIHFAERSQWRILAKLLWAFKIEPDIDPETGKPVKLDPEAYNTGNAHCPKPFKVVFKPRSKEHIATVRREAVSAEAMLAAYD